MSDKEKRSKMTEALASLIANDIKVMRKIQRKRLPQILGVFGKHNFFAGGLTPVELRTTLEDLGPTYVKIGQIMSSREDMLPKAFCDELGKLRQNVKPLDPAVARAVIEQETGKKISEIYKEFRDEPLGSASIGQVHYGVLKDGTRVVTKVQRPLIADMMRKDFAVLKKLADLLKVVSEGEGALDLKSVIVELEAVTEEELDFRVEAANTKFFKENCLDPDGKILCPDIIDELTTERIMTMTYVDGCSIGKKDKVVAQGANPEELGQILVENYMHQILDVGVFHGDPHQGNIMVSGGKPYWIDFGMMGHISEQSINLIQDIVVSMVTNDLDTLTNAVVTLGNAGPETDRGKLSEDLDAFIKGFLAISNIGDLDMSGLLGDLTDLASRNHMKLPGEYTMLVRGLATIEGVVEELCPEMNLFKYISDKMIERMKKSFELKETLINAGKDAIAAGKKVVQLPMLASEALSHLAKGRMKANVELTGYDDLVDKTQKMFSNGALILLSCFIFLGSSIMMLGACIMSGNSIPASSNLSIVPLIAILGILFSIALAIFTFRRMNKKK